MVYSKFLGTISICFLRDFQTFLKLKSLVTVCILVSSRKRFEPSFALGIAQPSDEVVSSIELTQDQFAQYVSGNVVTLDQTQPNGWYQLLVDGNGFDLLKSLEIRLKTTILKD